MRVRTEKVTPKRAQEWLDRSHDVNQRSLVRSRVDKLTHAILDGQWQLTHQPIAIDPDGRVLDGQHRLNAIVESGTYDSTVEVEVLVAWDSPPESFQVIDTGAARTTADTLKIAGFTNTNVLASAVRSKITYDDIVGTQDSFERRIRRFTSADVITYLADEVRNDDAQAALVIGNRVAQAVGRYGLRTSLAAVAMIGIEEASKTGGDASALGPDTLYEFFERLSDGAMLGAHSPILALRRWMIGDTGFGRVPRTFQRHVAICATIKTMNDHLAGRERSQILFRPGVEATPRIMSRAALDKLLDDREASLAAQEAAEELVDA